MKQSWCDLLFAHWPVPVDAVRHRVPAGLEVDVFGGSAWIAVVPFRMADVRLRALPTVPGTGAFLELNVRTYVTAEGKPGVWFFSLDAALRVAVAAARTWFGLPYWRAEMSLGRAGGAIEYASRRTHKGAPPAELRVRYAPAGEVFRSAPGTLEHLLTERYCLYAPARRGFVRGEVHHAPWPLRRAEAELRVNTMAAAAGFAVPETSPHLLFAERIDTVVWAPRRLDSKA